MATRRASRELLTLLVMFLLAACGPQPQDCASPNVFCAALVTDYGTVDAGIQREAWLGLQDAKAAHLVDRIDVIETTDTRDQAANIAVLAAHNYDVIVTVGASLADATQSAAQQHPALSFIGVEQPGAPDPPNFTRLVFHEDNSGFLAGALAARMTQTGTVAAVCEAKFIDSMRRYCDGFQAGVLYVRPDVRVWVAYRDGSSDLLFNDAQWGRAAALRDIQAGADVLFAAGGNTAAAALQAAAAQGVEVIGSETDLYLDMPELRAQLLTSAVNDVRPALLELLGRARQHQLPRGEYSGPSGLAPFHDWDRRIPIEVKNELEKISVGLDLGNIQTDVPYRMP